MNEFDHKAKGWDDNPMHMERSEAVAALIIKTIPLNNEMKALEYGGGTGLLSFLLKDHLAEIMLMDSSEGMLEILKGKIDRSGVKNFEPLCFDLERESYPGRFDFIFNQMVLHHVGDIDAIFRKFHKMLYPGGFLAIADLYPEDGSFHGEGFTGHKGFDPVLLSQQLSDAGFLSTRHDKCFVIKKETERGMTLEYPVFLVIAEK
jgi:tRNA (cmo5U34)-methyltransferase